jgi:hypothetical protein
MQVLREGEGGVLALKRPLVGAECTSQMEMMSRGSSEVVVVVVPGGSGCNLSGPEVDYMGY